jgi:TolB protein
MKHLRLLLMLAPVVCATILLSAQTPPQTPAQPPATQPPATQPPATQQPTDIEVMISGTGGLPPKLAVPELIPLSNEAETVAAAKTIAQVLWDDLNFEREFYLIPRDTYRSIPTPPSAEQVPLDRWKELGADGVVIGTIQKNANGYVIEVRVTRVSGGRIVFGKKYSGSLTSVKDGGRIYAHTASDDIHQQQRGLRGVARTWLVYSSDKAGERMQGPVSQRDISNIYRSDYDGANEVRLTVTRSIDITPVWAPDRSAVAYTSWRSGYPDILVQSMQGRELLKPARGGTPEVQNYLPAWSPDGSKLAFASSRDGNMEIYIVSRDGTGLRRLTNSPSIDVTPTWSPTGTQIAFVSERTGRPQIYVVNIDGTGLNRITNESHCDRPTWSPAPYNEIAYTSQQGGGNQIALYSFASGSTQVISDGIGSNESPAFAPNGRHIAFASDRTGQEQVYLIDRDGKNLRQITKKGRNRYPNWSQ